jgi:hypothetical protein
VKLLSLQHWIPYLGTWEDLSLVRRNCRQTITGRQRVYFTITAQFTWYKATPNKGKVNVDRQWRALYPFPTVGPNNCPAENLPEIFI